MSEVNKTEKQELASRLFLENYGLVRQIAFESAPSLSLADDIVNETFIYFTERAETWNYNEKIQPLLRTITQNIAKRAWRDHLRQLPQAYVQIAENAQKSIAMSCFFSNEVPYESKLTALDLCMQKLPPKTRNLVEMHYLHQVSIVEIVRQTGQSLSTLYKLLLAGRRLLHDCITNTLSGGWSHDD